MNPFDESRPSGEWSGVGSFGESSFVLEHERQRQDVDADRFFVGSWGDSARDSLDFSRQSLDAQTHPSHPVPDASGNQFPGYDEVTAPFGDGAHQHGHMQNGAEANAADNSSEAGAPDSHDSPFGSFQEGGQQMPVTNGPQERTVKSGWLRKKPSTGWGWRKRWFVLSNARLCYYTSPNNLGVQKIIAFDRAGLNVRTGSDLTELVLRCHQRTLVLKAQSQWECAQWIIAFQIVADELTVWGPPGAGGGAADQGGQGGVSAPLQEYGGSSVGLHKAHAASMSEQGQGAGAKVKRKMQDIAKFGGFFSGSERAAKMASPPPSREGSEHLDTSLRSSVHGSVHGATVHGATMHGTGTGAGQPEPTRGGVRSLDNSLHGQDLYPHGGSGWQHGEGAGAPAQRERQQNQEALLNQAAASLESFAIHDRAPQSTNNTAPVPIQRQQQQVKAEFDGGFGGSPMMASYGQSPGMLAGSFGLLGQSPGSAMWLAESPGQRGMSLLGTPQDRGQLWGYGDSPGQRGMMMAESPRQAMQQGTPQQQPQHGFGGRAGGQGGEGGPATEEGIAVPLPRMAPEQLDALPSATRASLIAQIESQQQAGSQSPRVVKAGRQAMELAMRFLGGRLYQVGPHGQLGVSQVLDAALSGFLDMMQGGMLEVKPMSSAFLTSTVLRGIIVKHQIADAPWPVVVSDPSPLHGQKLAGDLIFHLLPYVEMAPEADMLPPVLLPLLMIAEIFERNAWPNYRTL